MDGRVHIWKSAQEGTVAVLMAFTMIILVLFGALAVDLANFFYQRRALQSATDLAAIAAAANLNNATQVAQATLALNGFPASTLQSLTTGVYIANSAIPASQRFTAGASSASNNAVQIQTQIQVSYYLGSALRLVSASPTAGSVQTIGARATAALNPKASIAIGSGLASLQGGVLNAVIGGMLGANLSLSLSTYQSLAGANIDLFTFSNALASRVGLTAVTYNQLASTQFQANDVLGALATAAAANSAISVATVDALASLAAAAPTTAITVAPVISYGSYGGLTVGSSEPVSVSADALDLVSAIAQVANGTHEIQTSLSLNAPPIASATLALSIGSRPTGGSFVAIGPAGTTVYTAQTRLLLTLQIAQTGSTSLVSLPLYLEMGSASAQINNIQCGAIASATTLTLGVTPGLVNAWIGAITNAQLTNFASEPSPAAATLLNVAGVATVTGRANASIANTSMTQVSFTYYDIQDLAMKTTSTTDFVSSLLYNLFANLQLNASVLGLGLGLPSALNATVAATLASATIPIDQTVTQILDALGLGLGQAYTWVSGVRCGNASLVN